MGEIIKGIDLKVYSPLKGKLIMLSDVDDEVFATKALGDGVAIIPEIGEVYAPFSGKVESIFTTGHAISIKSETGADLLIHIGVNTVELDGQGFECFVTEGDLIEKGQFLIRFDIEYIKSKGLDTVTSLVVPNHTKFKEIEYEKSQNVEVGQLIMKIES
ncbi:PTS glucose transporter subunit IIA [Falseniella ignava]|uniref:PTS system, glucose subfamily, IIA component n=1 Tax=Falseniella ignava CCUG 37419 TaxID=883112 RepID=K1LMD2_9LACT|nr:PTS glucose transporter subunit IIA [Falseniella ignava]EKB55791.1 PTS system, glucose subfamily, IIA component [Falseniella ignava CCUG 37419]